MPLFRKKTTRISKVPDERRAELANAAEELFRTKGFSGTSVDEIVEHVGVSKGTFFYHFPSKGDVLIALGEMKLNAFREQIRSWHRDPKVTPIEKVSRFFGELANMRSLRRAVDWVGFGLIREDPVIHNALVNIALEPIVTDLESIIREGIATGDFRVTHPRATALCLVLLCADLIHRTGNTDRVVPWRELRMAVWEVVTRSLGLSETIS